MNNTLNRGEKIIKYRLLLNSRWAETLPGTTQLVHFTAHKGSVTSVKGLFLGEGPFFHAVMTASGSCPWKCRAHRRRRKATGRHRPAEASGSCEGFGVTSDLQGVIKMQIRVQRTVTEHQLSARRTGLGYHLTGTVIISKKNTMETPLDTNPRSPGLLEERLWVTLMQVTDRGARDRVPLVCAEVEEEVSFGSVCALGLCEICLACPARVTTC